MTTNNEEETVIQNEIDSVYEEEVNTTKEHPMLDDKAEEEYRLYQAKIKEEIEAAKLKVDLMYQTSNYTNMSQPVQPKSEIEESEQKRDSLNIDSLLRLFKSDFFDSWIGISYLFKYTSAGVHDYLCNQLYTMPDRDIEFYLIELWYKKKTKQFTCNNFLTNLLSKKTKQYHVSSLKI